MKPALKLLKWYKKFGRKLPWRKTRNPYHILVSEIMLQQTQVDRVKDYYQNWMQTFPNWRSLANADQETLIRSWSGLGYNKRALMLRSIAQHVVKHGIPKTEESWKALKGIGPYTAAAISAFAQKKRTLPIDTNIRRVLGRFLIGKPFPLPDLDLRIQKHSDSFLPKQGNFYDVPQAIFDLATNICTKKPECMRCPLRKDCVAAKKFLSGKIRVPKQAVKKSTERHHAQKKYPDRIYRGKILSLVQRIPGIAFEDIGPHIDPTFHAPDDQAWIEHMIMRMHRDGLIRIHEKTIFL